MGMLGLYRHKCRQCGKEFECRKEYVFKRIKPEDRDMYWYFCSNKCIRAYDAEQNRKHYRNRMGWTNT